MIGFVVFTILALGLTSTALHNLRSAQMNIMKNTAYSAAQGFLEQLKSIPESAILEAIADPSGSPLPTRSISADGSGGVTHIDSPLYLTDPAATSDGENHRRILVDLRDDGNGGITEVFMDMWFDVNISKLTTSRGYLIEIEFTYSHPALSYLPRQIDSVRGIRTSGAEN